MGPALFFGLLVYALATYSPPDVTYANPADSLELEEVTAEATISPPLVFEQHLLPNSPEPHHALRRPDSSTRPTSQTAELRFPGPDRRHPVVVGDFRGIVRPLPAALGVADFETSNSGQPPQPGEPGVLIQIGATREGPVARGNALPTVRGVFQQDFGLAVHGADPLRVGSSHFSERHPGTLPDTLSAPHPSGLRPESPMATLKSMAVGGENVHLRKGPGIGFPTLATTRLGDLVHIVGTIGNWRRVVLRTADGEVSGWMYVDYLPDIEN